MKTLGGFLSFTGRLTRPTLKGGDRSCDVILRVIGDMDGPSNATCTLLLVIERSALGFYSLALHLEPILLGKDNPHVSAFPGYPLGAQKGEGSKFL